MTRHAPYGRAIGRLRFSALCSPHVPVRWHLVHDVPPLCSNTTVHKGSHRTLVEVLFVHESIGARTFLVAKSEGFLLTAGAECLARARGWSLQPAGRGNVPTFGHFAKTSIVDGRAGSDLLALLLTTSARIAAWHSCCFGLLGVGEWRIRLSQMARGATVS